LATPPKMPRPLVTAGPNITNCGKSEIVFRPERSDARHVSSLAASCRFSS